MRAPCVRERREDGGECMSYVVRGVEELPPLIRVDRAARVADCSQEEIRKLLRNGKLRGPRYGRVWRVNSASLLEYLGLSDM